MSAEVVKYHKNDLPFDEIAGAKYVQVEADSGGLAMVVGLHEKDYFVSWRTAATPDEFLLAASRTIDVLDRVRKPRPKTTKGSLMIGNELGKVVFPSYSGFSYGHIEVQPSQNLPLKALTLKSLQWPLSMQNIREQAHKKGGFLPQVDPEQHFIRINAKTVSLLYGNEMDTMPRSISFWSHIYPLALLLELYDQTATPHVGKQIFLDALEESVGKHSEKYPFVPIRF